MPQQPAYVTATAAELQPTAANQQVSGEVISVRVPFDGAVPSGQGKLRLDAFLAGEVPRASRARLAAAIRAGHVAVNGRLQAKAAHALRPGDLVSLSLPPLPPLRCEPEDLPLAVVYEDAHLLVVDKAAGVVVHPAPGNERGTLVAALLHHCRLPAMELLPGQPPLPSARGLAGAAEAEEDIEDTGEDEDEQDGDDGAPPALTLVGGGSEAVIRPGIVHRIDKGTTGLLVVAKDEQAHAHLAAQFKAHTVQREYVSIVLGCPKAPAGVVETNIGRSASDRKKMAVFGAHANRGRFAASTYQVLEPLAAGAAALVAWRLRTGRTHQIRVHARHLGHALFGDDAYGGAGGSALAAVARGKAARQAVVHRLLKALGRPALHARTLGFVHPATGAQLAFESALPADFVEALTQLRDLT